MKKQSHDVETVSGRVAWLMEKLWRGSQTEMSAYLGVTQGTIANILAGRRKPGRTLLPALAAHPLVNEQWLREGVGSPLLPEATGPVGEAALPIAQKLFAGMPHEHPDCLAEVLHPVSQRLCRRSRSWIHVDEPHHPFAADPKLPLRVGDWLLMEPDSSNWPDDLRGKPCLANVKLSDRRLLGCCRGETSTAVSKTTHDFDFLGQLPEGIEDHKSLFHEGRLKSNIDLDQPATTRHPRLKRLPVKVVAVGIYRCGDL